MTSEQSQFRRSNPPDVEEVIFYLDLITDVFRKKIILKGLKDFIDDKNSYSARSSFGVVLFQGDSNPITSYNKDGSKEIIQLIKEGWDTRDKEMSFFENGLFEILSYIFMKSQQNAKNFRVIIISDTPSERNEDYSNALYDLIVKSKMFNTTIDIIRIGDEKYYSDDVKLKIITSETQGGIFYCEPDSRRFLDIIGSLIKNRKEFNIIRTDDGGSSVLEKDKPFYEKLAVDLITLEQDDEEVCNVCDRDLCPICDAYSDEVRKCYNCGLKFHSCCASLYSINNHIGEFIHIFKCPQCETLLKLDEEYVKMIYLEERGEEYEEEEPEEKLEEAASEDGAGSKYSYESFVDEEEIETSEPLQPEEIENKEESEVEMDNEPVIQPEENSEPEVEKPAAESQEILPPPKSPPTRKVKVGGFFGGEIEIKGTAPVKKPETPSENIPAQSLKEEKVSITKLRPPKRRSNIKFCKICGTSCQNTIICPTCGNKVED